MTRKRFNRKMMYVIYAMHEEMKRNGKDTAMGASVRHMCDADLSKALKEYGSYAGIWNSNFLADLRKAINI